VSVLDEDFGVVIDIDGRHVAVFNVHLADFPYQPYQLTNIEYGDAPMLLDEASAIAAAAEARGPAVELILDVVAQLADIDLVVICGDFNEPSHLDWTERAARAGRHPLKVAFPTSATLANAGFIDGYRSFRPDEVADPGFTYTPLAAIDDENEHHDRIDFVYLKGDNVGVTSAAVAGESPATSDIVVTPWPSDHRAVVVSLRF
jgi:endonuclease/exonuclease/phosphatase family metal-dependent hydrolase